MSGTSSTALVVGASRGIGLGLTRELLERGWQVTGTVRDPAAALPLAGATVAVVDVSDPDAPAVLRADLGAETLDLVLLNAGVTGPAHQSADRVTAEELGALFVVNAAAPVRLARALLDRVRPGGVVAFTSSRMGSVADNRTGDMELYRASKAALNSLVRGFAATSGRDDVAVLVLHPGWVRTEMGGPDAPLDVATSARGLADVIERHRDTGRHAFVDHTGAEVPW